MSAQRSERVCSCPLEAHRVYSELARVRSAAPLCLRPLYSAACARDCSCHLHRAAARVHVCSFAHAHPLASALLRHRSCPCPLTSALPHCRSCSGPLVCSCSPRWTLPWWASPHVFHGFTAGYPRRLALQQPSTQHGSEPMPWLHARDACAHIDGLLPLLTPTAGDGLRLSWPM